MAGQPVADTVTVPVSGRIAPSNISSVVVLTGAVRAEEPDALARRNRNADPAHGLHLLEGLAQLVRDQDVIAAKIPMCSVLRIAAPTTAEFRTH